MRGTAIGALTRFLRDERGTASMEFVVTLPLLLGPLLITAEYGNALTVREQLDSALADATQLLAAAPALPGWDDTENDGIDAPPVLQQIFVDRAEDLIAERLALQDPERVLFKGETVNRETSLLFEARISENLTSDPLDPNSLATRPFYVVKVRAVVQLDLGLLAFFNGFFRNDAGDYEFSETLPILAVDEARYISPVPPIDNVPGCDWGTTTEGYGLPADITGACRTFISGLAAAQGDTDAINRYVPESSGF